MESKGVKFSICVPTRQRPHFMKRLCKSVFSNALNPSEVEVIFYIDEDDEYSKGMAERLSKKNNIKWVIGERIVLAQMWNECYAVSSGEIFMHCGDDITINTPKWDEVVERVFDLYEDKIVLVFGADGYQNNKMATHGFYHKKWVEAVGYLTPPYFSSDYCDMWLYEMALELDRAHYLHYDLYTEHHHWICDKAPKDLNHQERLERQRLDNVEGLYESLHATRLEDVEKLRNVMDATIPNKCEWVNLTIGEEEGV